MWTPQNGGWKVTFEKLRHLFDRVQKQNWCQHEKVCAKTKIEIRSAGGVEWMNRYTLDSYNNRAPAVQKILLSKSQDCE